VEVTKQYWIYYKACSTTVWQITTPETCLLQIIIINVKSNAANELPQQQSEKTKRICWNLGTQPATVSATQCREAVIDRDSSTVQIHDIAQRRLYFLHLPLNDALQTTAVQTKWSDNGIYFHSIHTNTFISQKTVYTTATEKW